jgi:hypothetical protein
LNYARLSEREKGGFVQKRAWGSNASRFFFDLLFCLPMVLCHCSLSMIQLSNNFQLTHNMQNETRTIHTSLLVVTKDGKLIRIHTPFPVQVITSVETLNAGEVHKVNSIHMGEVTLLYVIGDRPFNHTYFIILTNRK